MPRAWELVHGGGLDPGWYDYPSLLFLLLAPFQAFADAPSYGAGRGVAAGLGLIGVAAAWWLGRASYGLLAGLVAGAAVAVATVHVAYSHVAVTDVLLTALVTVSLALAVHGRLEWAGAAAGLAASAKYPGVFLAAPLLAVGWGQWRRLAIGAAAAVLAFAAHEPVRRLACRRRVGRHLARPAAGGRGLARLRARPSDAACLPRPPLGEPRPGAARRARRARARRTSACVETPQALRAPRRRRARELRPRLLRLPAHPRRPFRPLRAPARARARRPRRTRCVRSPSSRSRSCSSRSPGRSATSAS